MARTHDTAPIVDTYGNPVGNAKVEAYDVTDDSLQETQYTNSSGIASFTALHDTNDSDLKIMWGLFNVTWRRHIFETGGGGGTPSSDHGALTGLADDDHAQYHTNARGDARYYTQAQVASAIAAQKLDDHAAPDDNTDNDASAAKHGLMPKADKSKLDAIEATADITDAANVNAAGATMNADTNVKANGWVIDEDNMASDLDTKVPTQQSVKAYADSIAGVSEGTVIAIVLGLGG